MNSPSSTGAYDQTCCNLLDIQYHNLSYGMCVLRGGRLHTLLPFCVDGRRCDVRCSLKRRGAEISGEEESVEVKVEG